MRTQFVMSELAIGLRRNVTMTVAAVVTIMISVTMLGGALVIRSGANHLEHDILNQIEVSVYLQPQCGTPNAPTSDCLTQSGQASIQHTLQQLPQVQSITFISQQSACERFKADPSEKELAKITPCSALPASFAVKLKDPHQFDVINSAVSAAPGVQTVTDAQHIFDGLFHFFHVLELAVLFVMLVSLSAAILLIYNAMLVAAFSRRRETGIMRLVGASDFYIQAPFILEGSIIGVVGTGLAIGFLAIGRFLIKGALGASQLTKPFGDGSNYTHAIWPMILVGILLPSVASFVTLQRHMRV